MNASRTTEEIFFVLAPVGRDGELICEAAKASGLAARQCADLTSLLDATNTGVAGLILTEEALDAAVASRLVQFNRDQPHWSYVPMIATVDNPDTVPDPLRMGSSASLAMNLLLLRRPMTASTLVSAMRLALHDRRRQYRVRDLLAEVDDLNRHLERRVAERTQQVRELGKELAQAEAQERRRIAHILHDDLQQVLVAVQWKLGGLSEQLSPQQRQEAEQLGELTRQAIDTSRSLSSQLAPTMLDDQGLVDTLRWLANHFERNVGLQVEVEPRVEREIVLPNKEQRTMAFQLTRELLLNVAKHAEVKEAKIMIEPAEAGVAIVVADHGKGFDPRKLAENGDGFGLGSVQRRLELLGGRFRLRSAPGQGTRIEMVLPVDGDGHR